MNRKTKLSTLIGASVVATMAVANTASADSTLFGYNDLQAGYKLAFFDGDEKGKEGKCGEGKCGADKKGKEGKCGEGKCGEDKKGKEGKCGEGKCGEGKCGEDKKGKEGKCGEGKCGENKDAKKEEKK